MPAKIAPREHAKSLIDRAIRATIARTSGKPRKAFLGLLADVQSQSEMLRPARFRGWIDLDRIKSILGGLLSLSGHRKDWLRPVATWAPSGSNQAALFSSLAHHLLADYPVPPVLLSGWFLGDDWQGRQQQRWFKRAGRGMSLRSVGFPIPLTRRMAHEFARAPAEFPIEFALRWAQVRGLGGPDPLARAIASTRLGWDFNNPEFWTGAVHFFLNHPKLDLDRIGPVVDFLHAQRYEHRRAIIGEDTEVYLDPPQPDLSLKGWSVASLLRRIEEWKVQRAAELKRSVFRWECSGIGEFLDRDKQGRAWSIRELLDSDELAAEGRAMEHCVAVYTSSCAKRISTIWSVGIEGDEGRERVVTLEVDPASRAVVQAKARENEDPEESCLAIIRQWAVQQNLKWEACDGG